MQDDDPKIDDKIYRVPDVAHIWGMTPGAVRQAVERGAFPLPPRRMGRVMYWTPGDVASFLWSDARRRGGNGR